MAAKHKEVPMDFINWLKEEREKRRWSQAELGRRSDILPSVISRWESGEWAPNANSALKIANAFGFDPQFVMEIAGLAPRRRSGESTKIRQLESALRYVDWEKPNRFEAIMGMVRMFQEDDTKASNPAKDGRRRTAQSRS